MFSLYTFALERWRGRERRERGSWRDRERERREKGEGEVEKGEGRKRAEERKEVSDIGKLDDYVGRNKTGRVFTSKYIPTK